MSRSLLVLDALPTYVSFCKKKRNVTNCKNLYLQALACIEKRLDEGKVVNASVVSFDMHSSDTTLTEVIQHYPMLGRLIADCKRHLGQTNHTCHPALRPLYAAFA